MKHKLIFFTIILGFFCSCEKEDPIEQLDTFLIIGDYDAVITSLDTVIYPPDRGDSVLYQIDLDSNGLKDFGFYIYYNFSPCIFFSKFRFDCLNDKAKV